MHRTASRVFGRWCSLVPKLEIVYCGSWEWPLSPVWISAR
jgi:hypothetical protein